MSRIQLVSKKLFGNLGFIYLLLSLIQKTFINSFNLTYILQLTDECT